MLLAPYPIFDYPFCGVIYHSAFVRQGRVHSHVIMLCAFLLITFNRVRAVSVSEGFIVQFPTVHLVFSISTKRNIFKRHVVDLCYQPTTAALFTQCVLTASEAFFFFLISLFLPVFVFFLAPFLPARMFCNSSLLRGPFSWFCVVLLFLYSLMFTLQMSQTVSSEALDAVYWPRRLWASTPP